MISKLRRMRKNRLALIAASLVLTPAAATGASVDSQITAGIVLPDRTIDGMGDAERLDDRTPDRSLAHIVTLKSGLDALSQGERRSPARYATAFPGPASNIASSSGRSPCGAATMCRART